MDGISFFAKASAFIPTICIPSLVPQQISCNQVIKLSLVIAASEDAASDESVEKKTNYRRNCYGHCLVNLRDRCEDEADGWMSDPLC